MERVLTRIRETVLAEARERLAQIESALTRLKVAPSDREACLVLQRHLHRLATEVAAFGLGELSAAACEADDTVTAALLLERRVGQGTIAAVEGLLARAGGDASPPGAPVLLTTQEPVPEGMDLLDLSRSELVRTVAELETALGKRPVPVVVLDAREPVKVLREAASLVRAWRSPFTATPPVIAFGQDLGVVTRYSLREAGVGAWLLPDTPRAEAARILHKLLRERDSARFVAFLLGAEPDIRDALEKELLAEDIKVQAFPAMPEMLRRWVERPPDLVMVAFTRGSGAALRAVTDLKEDPEAGELPLIVVTDRTDQNTRRALLDAGADDWVAFPWVENELRTRVVQPLNLRRLAARGRLVVSSQLKSAEVGTTGAAEAAKTPAAPKASVEAVTTGASVQPHEPPVPHKPVEVPVQPPEPAPAPEQNREETLAPVQEEPPGPPPVPQESPGLPEAPPPAPEELPPAKPAASGSEVAAPPPARTTPSKTLEAIEAVSRLLGWEDDLPAPGTRKGPRQ